MVKKRKQEFTWIGKENRPELEPRNLLQESKKSFHAKRLVKDTTIFMTNK